MGQLRFNEQLCTDNIRYKDIIDNTDSFFVRWEAESHKIIYCNQPYADRWASSVDDLIGKSIYELRMPNERDSLQSFLADIKPGESKSGIFKTAVPDGSIRAARTFTQAITYDGINIVVPKNRNIFMLVMSCLLYFLMKPWVYKKN